VYDDPYADRSDMVLTEYGVIHCKFANDDVSESPEEDRARYHTWLAEEVSGGRGKGPHVFPVVAVPVL
jgi:hypothetical protein